MSNTRWSGLMRKSIYLSDLGGGTQYSTPTINWRGEVAESSGKALLAFNILRRTDFKILAARCMVGSTMVRRVHQRMTSSGPAKRKGEG